MICGCLKKPLKDEQYYSQDVVYIPVSVLQFRVTLKTAFNNYTERYTLKLSDELSIYENDDVYAEIDLKTRKIKKIEKKNHWILLMKDPPLPDFFILRVFIDKIKILKKDLIFS